MARKPAAKGIESRLAGVERGLRSLRANDAAIAKEVRDGFVKLHETLDIELKVMKEQMKRLEERVDHLEAAGKS